MLQKRALGDEGGSRREGDVPARAMDNQLLRAVLTVLVGLAVVAAGFVVGRTTGPGARAGERFEQGYRAGLDVGQSSGIEQGRALQLGLSVPPSSRTAVQEAFEAGYAAGANDVFGTYDGGWAFGRPYLVVLEPGSDGVTYRIARRQELPQPSPGP